MEFPFYLHLGEWQIHPHPVFEALAYLLGFRLYLALRKRGGDPIDKRTRGFIRLAAIGGSAVGSKGLLWHINPALPGAPASVEGG